MEWPYWWEWEVDCDNPHLLKRMRDRQFSESDLREMLAEAIGWEPNHVPDRFVIRTVRSTDPWAVIVEPDQTTRTLIVVTAYPIDADDL